MTKFILQMCALLLFSSAIYAMEVRVGEQHLVDSHDATEVKSQYRIELLTGKAMEALVPFLAQQRVEGYSGYPYLYEGDVNQEVALLTWHAAVPQAAFAIAYLGETPVGFVLGVPFGSYGDQLTGSIELFKKHSNDPHQFYYITDVIILPAHREKSLSTRLIKLIEQHAQSSGFHYACFVSEAHEKHDLKPLDYKDPAGIWGHLGYEKTGMVVFVSWNTKQINGPAKEQEHPLPYWIKELK